MPSATPIYALALWHLLVLTALIAGVVRVDFGVFFAEINGDGRLFGKCLFWGGIGGVIYCLRGLYLNYCALNQWNNRWIPWHFIRPLISLLCGGVSFLFLKAGLIALEAVQASKSLHYAYYAFAFLAGYNVDNFLKKIEGVSKAALGIKASRASQESEKETPDKAANAGNESLSKNHGDNKRQ